MSATDPIAGWNPRPAMTRREADEALATLARVREKARRRFPQEPTFRCRYCHDSGFITTACECGNPRCVAARRCDRCVRSSAKQRWARDRDEGGTFS